MKECLLYEKIGGGKLKCTACNHFCIIEEGKTGICGIRQNKNEKLNLLTYGKAVAVHVDPIEKKPLFHFLPGSQAFSFGTIGCNFRCANCQNFDISQMFDKKREVTEYSDLHWGAELSPEQAVKMAKETGSESIAYTYNEPTIFVEYGLDTMRLAHQEGLKNVWVSNGFMSNETLDIILPFLDAINVDLKFFDDKLYRTNCGAQLAPVLENLKRLAREDIWLETTTLLIPTLSDDEKQLREIAEFMRDELGDHVPWHVSAFFGEISWRLKNLPATPVETVMNAYAIGKDVGLKYIYTGNVWDPSTESTYCPECSEMIVKRTGYTIDRRDKNGRCPKCDVQIHGIFIA